MDDSDSNKDDKGVIKVEAIVENEVENGTTIFDLLERRKQERKETMKMTTLEADVKKDLTNGVKYNESLKKEVVATLNNHSEKEAVAPAPDVKEVIDASSPEAKNDVEVESHGPSNPTETWKPATVEVEAENGTTIQPKKITNGETILKAKPNASDEEVIANAPVITEQGIDAPAPPPAPEADVKKDSTNGVKYDELVKKEVEVEIQGPSNPCETWKHSNVEAKVENGTTNQPEKIANGETTLKEKPNAHDAENDVKVNQPEITNGKTTLEAKSNVSGDVELPTSDPNEIIKIEREERGSSKINKQSIYAKEDPEGGAEAGKQRVREVFHMDVAELIIERDA